MEHISRARTLLDIRDAREESVQLPAVGTCLSEVKTDLPRRNHSAGCVCHYGKQGKTQRAGNDLFSSEGRAVTEQNEVSWGMGL